GYKGSAIGIDVLPALLGVGFIVGPAISAYMLAGAVLGWFVIMPLFAHLGQYIPNIIYPATKPLLELGYWKIWENYLRYIGAGAVAFGGILSLIKSLPLIVKTFKESLSDLKNRDSEISTLRTEQDMSMRTALIGIIIVILFIAITPVIPVGLA